MNPIQHITADVPADLVKQVDERVNELGVTRSFAVRKGLSLFLRVYRQILTETVITEDIPTAKQPEPEAAHDR